ncbi:MAG: AAA family ATPase, partial [Chloroflexota bacterium]
MIRLLSLRAAKFKQLDDVTLAFPQRGSVLIQGLNEAGKSTLFESVFFALFGKALVTEEPNRLDDLINYQSPRSLVKLAFATDGANFAVSRTLNRGKPNTAVLEVEYAGGKREMVTNLTAVNRRIADELRLDSDAVLNSCFVEQKKLEKLESMTAQQRRDTLLRLLNLDRLAALEAQYKPSSSDDYQLQQLRDRLKLAEIQRDLPLNTTRLGAVESELRLLAGVRLHWEIASLGETIGAEQRRRTDLEREAERLVGALAEVEQLKTVRDLARTAGETLLAMDEDRAETERVKEELAKLQVDAARLPQIEVELTRLDSLAADLAELARLDEAQAQRRRELVRLAEAGERVQRLRASVAERRTAQQSVASELAEARVEVERREAAERRVRQAELLRGWLQIREVAAIAQEGERELSVLRRELTALDHKVAEHASERHVKQRTAFGLAVAALLAVGLAAGLTAGHIAAGLAGLPLAAVLAVACWFFAARAAKAAHALKAAEAASASLRMDLNRREGEQALAHRTGQDPRRLAELEAELTTLGFQPPASVAQAHETLAGIQREPDPSHPSEQSPTSVTNDAQGTPAGSEPEPFSSPTQVPWPDPVSARRDTLAGIEEEPPSTSPDAQPASAADACGAFAGPEDEPFSARIGAHSAAATSNLY